jgi:hypothetical protein
MWCRTTLVQEWHDSPGQRHGRAVVTGDLEPSLRALLHRGHGHLIDPDLVFEGPDGAEITLGGRPGGVGANGQDN